MPTTWKWKVALLGFLTLLSLSVVLPSFLGEKTPSWMPQKTIHLGLDLQGGIYVEFEVEVDEAIQNKVELLVDELKKTVAEKNISLTEITQQTSPKHTILIRGNTEAIQATVDVIEQNYQETLVFEGSENGTAIFRLDEKYHKYLYDQMIKQALEKIRNRVDRYGVAEPSIQRLGSHRIAVELPGIDDPDRAIEIVKKAGVLEFKMVDERLSQAELIRLIDEARKEHSIAQDNFSIETAKKLTELLQSQLPEGTEIAFEVTYDPIARKITGGTPYLLSKKIEVSGEMLRNAQVNVQNNEPYVGIAFDAQGTERFADTTKNNVQKRLAILLDGVVTSAPVIQEPILGGQASISLGYGAYPDLLKEAEDLALVLQEGALPARLTEATKTVVGPSLGADSIRDGVTATVIGAIAIFIFMLLYYKGSGLIANVTLVLNLLFILSALALLKATLTLPGIAGIVLTLGMAVDANILIFERIREELRLGKSARAAVEAGYHNAMRTIIDANVTTVISGIVLYQFGTGPIKGFAVTLILGLVISMYTACLCSRMVYDYFLTVKRVERISV
ncbi:MAG: protein-export membrane protein SecD [Deltaproteobacteria bacterium RIFCSPLOWO2_02_FULL_44_10]|nr:MAG: protein-export membrane protein SecD [Deltaproteobacteria bacterium RIFCSPHIGHO2_02_FULL_44_16]OGQ45475.1 MAG: protein-export membrane protein SecD [Deltaproteobacteria bacterium RIFCSPLOWO2_02_FULL_44_10]